MIIFNPFTTKLLTSRRGDDLTVHAVRFGFYSLLPGVAAVLVLAVIHHMTHADLLEPGPRG